MLQQQPAVPGQEKHPILCIPAPSLTDKEGCVPSWRIIISTVMRTTQAPAGNLWLVQAAYEQTLDCADVLMQGAR